MGEKKIFSTNYGDYQEGLIRDVCRAIGTPAGNWNPINGYAIRKALASGRYVYATAASDGREFRITRLKRHRGLAYGMELRTGKWVVIGQWQVR